MKRYMLRHVTFATFLFCKSDRLTHYCASVASLRIDDDWHYTLFLGLLYVIALLLTFLWCLLHFYSYILEQQLRWIDGWRHAAAMLRASLSAYDSMLLQGVKRTDVLELREGVWSSTRCCYWEYTKTILAPKISTRVVIRIISTVSMEWIDATTMPRHNPSDLKSGIAFLLRTQRPPVTPPSWHVVMKREGGKKMY